MEGIKEKYEITGYKYLQYLFFERIRRYEFVYKMTEIEDMGSHIILYDNGGHNVDNGQRTYSSEMNYILDEMIISLICKL